jgi:hypothetical protein
MVRERFPRARLIANAENVGFARANNQAMAMCSGRYAVLLNSDTEVRPGALRELVAFMDRRPDVGAAGPLLLNADGSLQPSCHPMLTPGREFWRLMFLDRLRPQATYAMERWSREEPHVVEVIKGACLMLRRATLDQVGLLDERYLIYTEEVDLCYRNAQAGWGLYWVPTAHVMHFGAASTSQMAERMYIQLYRSKVQFIAKFGGRVRAAVFKVLIAMAYLPRVLSLGLLSLARRGLRERARIAWRLLLALPGMG